jgi:hypothetical protein
LVARSGSSFEKKKLKNDKELRIPTVGPQWYHTVCHRVMAFPGNYSMGLVFRGMTFDISWHLLYAALGWCWFSSRQSF